MIAVKTDLQIQEEVMQELKWDSRIDETAIGVAVDKGVVTLTGTVSNYAKKLAAQEAAHKVIGVFDVANELTVKGFEEHEHTDVEIAHAVRRALEWDVWVPDRDIQSTVSNGWVTMEGKVKLLRERQDSERAIKHLAGVRGVINKIEVEAPRIRSTEVQGIIEEALARRAEREADRIQVDVSDGEVTLSGRVHSWEEKRAIMGAVSHARGVRDVKDRLVINPYL